MICLSSYLQSFSFLGTFRDGYFGRNLTTQDKKCFRHVGMGSQICLKVNSVPGVTLTCMSCKALPQCTLATSCYMVHVQPLQCELYVFLHLFLSNFNDVLMPNHAGRRIANMNFLTSSGILITILSTQH